MIPSIIVDVVLAAIMAIIVITSVKRGFVKTVARPVKFVAAFALAWSLCNYISVEFIEGLIQTPIANQLKDFLYEKCANLTPENVSTELPTLLKMVAGMVGINLEEIAQGSTSGVVDGIVERLTGDIVHVIGIIVSFIAVYFAAKLVLSLVIMLIDMCLRSGPLGIINKILGLIFGAAFAVILAWLVVVVAEFVMSFIGYDFDSGFVYDFFSNFNPLDLLLSF